MKLARYVGHGRIEVREEPDPEPQEGGLIVQTRASGLCSGELMDWYMEGKVPHVLGHEVCGTVVWSDDPRFPIGSRVAPHHHAPCMVCEVCKRGRHVHCEQWKRTRLVPGGMAERFCVPKDNLTDTYVVEHLRPQDAALMEPLGCVAKSIRAASIQPEDEVAVIGLGSMGIAHLLIIDGKAVGYDMNPNRRAWARDIGLSASPPDHFEPADTVIVCPGNTRALAFATKMVRPGGTIVLFAPFPPDEEPHTPLNRLYFSDVRIVTSYSCGPDDTAQALEWLKSGRVRAEQLVSDFIAIQDLPKAYVAMKAGEILKAMVLFD